MLEIASLDEKYRVPLMLYYMDGFTTEEIARSLGLTPAAVRKRISRARLMLKEQLEWQPTPLARAEEQYY